MERWTEFTFSVQGESASALKCDTINISQTEHTGNIRMENNRRLEQTAHNIPVANKILMSLDHFTQFEALNVKHIIHSIHAGTTVSSRLQQQIQSDTFKCRSRILRY